MATFVATKTMTVRGEDGQVDDLVAGQSFVYDEQHYLIRTYPDLWAPPANDRRSDASAARKGDGRSDQACGQSPSGRSRCQPPARTHPTSSRSWLVAPPTRRG